MRIVHETNPQKYFPAILDLAKNGHIELTGLHRYSVVKEWLRAGLKDRTPFLTRTRNAVGDAAFRLKIPRISGETILLGFAPWDWRLAIYGRLARKNRVLLHTSWPDWSRDAVPRSTGPFVAARRRLWLRFLQHPNVEVVCILPQIQAELSERFSVASTVVPHAVPAVFFEQPRDRPGGPLRLIYVGELSEKKGIPTLLALMERLSGEEVSLTLVGDGPLRPACERAAALNASIEFHGPERDREVLAALVGEHHVLTLLSRREGSWEELFGIVIVEAIAAGTVVVATDHVGPRTLLGGTTPELVLPEDSLAAVESALRAMMADRGTVTELADRQYPTALPFLLSSVAGSWLELLVTPEDVRL